MPTVNQGKEYLKWWKDLPIEDKIQKVNEYFHNIEDTDITDGMIALMWNGDKKTHLQQLRELQAKILAYPFRNKEYDKYFGIERITRKSR